MDLPFHPRDLIRIARRRRWYILIPLVSIVVAFVLLANSLPNVYQATATVLIEDQEIPEDLVPSLVGDFVERRLETLSRLLLVRENLLRLAERHGLYAAEREVMPPDAIAELMRKQIELDVIQTDIVDRSGRRGVATVAVQLSFSDRDPAKAQRVANELVSLYLQTNLEQRRSTAQNATAFLAAERARAEERIAQLEADLLAFQSENLGLLPDDVALVPQTIVRLEETLRAGQRELQSLREREAFLQTQMALTDEFVPAAGTGRVTPSSQLAVAQADLATARARYSASHPDVVRLEREVASLQRVVGEGGGNRALLAQEAELAAELGSLRERYTPNHPDVVRVQRQLASVRDAIARAGTGADAGLVRSPAYVQLSAQLNAVQAEATSVAQRNLDVQAEIERLQDVLARAPAVEQEYQRRTRALAEAVATRDDLATRQATAQLGQSLEAGAVGERLLLVEPPVFPNSPVSPNRKLIVALGVVLGLGGGLGLATLMELIDRSVRSAKDLVRLLGDKPLVMIPTLATKGDMRRRWAFRLGALAVLALVVAGGLSFVHRAYAPLDVLLFQAQTRADAWWQTTFPGAGDSLGTQE